MSSITPARWLFRLAAPALAVCLLASGAQAAPAAERFIVAFKPGAAAAARAAVAHAGGEVDLDLGRANAIAVRMPAAAAAALARHAAVAYVEADVMRFPMRRPGGAQPVRPLAVPGVETVPYGIAMVQADQLAYNAANPRTLCIIDSGYDIGHEDLQKTNVAGVNLTRSGGWDTDENSHGTHVAGTIGAIGNNGVGVVGVVGSGQMPLFIAKVFEATGGAPNSRIVRAMQACADAGANVISMSLGGSQISRTEQRTVDDLAAANVLVVAAAGNAGDATLSYPAGFAGAMSVAAVDAAAAWAPFSQFNADVEIAAPGVAVDSTVPAGTQTGASLAVGAGSYAVQAMEGSPRSSASAPLADFGLGDVARRGTMTGKVCLIQRGVISFADKVKNCERSGGVGAVIYNNEAGALFGTLADARTAIPSVGASQADGQAMLAQLGQAAAVAVFGSADLYAYYSGTSMATPHVAAVAALVWSHHPQCSAAQIRSSLTRSALDLDAPGRDDRTGAGLVQARAAFDRVATLGCGN